MAKSAAAKLIDDALAEAKKQPYGIVAKVLEMDDALARELIARNRNNRVISKARVRRYRQDAESGSWALNGQPIIVSDDGVLGDGQHRAAAVEGTDFKIPTLFVFGVPAAARVTMDQGRARNAGDYMSMLGEETGQLSGTLVRYLMAYEENKGRDLRGLARRTPAELIRFFEANADRVRRSAEFGIELRDAAKLYAPATMLAFLHYILTPVDEKKAEQYLRQVAKGENLTEDDPAYVVRQKLLAGGRALIFTKKAELILNGWRAFVAGRKLGPVRVQGRLPGI